MFKIHGKDHKVIGIKDGRVVFQLMEKKEYWSDRERPTFKIKFRSEHGYHVCLPNENNINFITVSEILKDFDLLNEIICYYKTKEDQNDK